MAWSLTSLHTFEQCTLKYKYKYIQRLEEPRSYAAARGVDKHKMVEDFVNDGVPLPPELDFYHGFLSNLKAAGGKPEVKLAMNKSWEPCDWKAEDVWWRGVLDMLVLTPKEAIVYDWKTGKIWPDHEQQRELYCIATAQHFPELQQMRGIHVYVDLGKNRQHVYHRSELRSLQAKWETRVNRVTSAVEFFPNPSFKCRFCPFSRYKGGPCQF